MSNEPALEHLDPTEKRALVEFVRRLRERFDGGLRTALLFGSKARGTGTQGSDLDVLVVVNSDDWQVHKQIRYLAADICLEYNLQLSPRVWGPAHQKEMEQLQSQLYQNILRDGISLSALE